jgi:hypothetical protein
VERQRLHRGAKLLLRETSVPVNRSKVIV